MRGAAVRGAAVLAAALVGLLLVPSAGSAQRDRADSSQPRQSKPGRPAQEAGEPARVLLLGDSISLGYTPVVRRLLAGRAIIDRPLARDGTPRNNLSSQVARAKLSAWLEEIDRREGVRAWDLVYFNFGLHDLMFLGARGLAVPAPRAERQGVPLWRYERNLHWIVGRLRKLAPRLVFATTTPGVPGGKMDEDQVVLYNLVARRVMDREGVPVDDLYGLVRPRLAELQKAGDVHFRPSGYEALGRRVAETIEKALPASGRARDPQPPATRPAPQPQPRPQQQGDSG